MTADNFSLLCIHLSHLTYFPLKAPPHSSHYISSLSALGLYLLLDYAEKAEYNHYNHNKDQTAHGGMCHTGSSARKVTGRHVTSH